MVFDYKCPYSESQSYILARNIQLSSSHGDGHDRVHVHAHVHVDAHDHGDAPSRDALDAPGVHDTPVPDHRPRSLVADSNHLLVHIAHTSPAQLQEAGVLNIADAEDSRFVDVDTADAAAARIDTIAEVVRNLYYGSVQVSLQERLESDQYLTGTLRILRVY